MHEAQMHEATSFLTLTYTDDQLPVDNSLDVEHWKRFAKRLRKAKGPFRFLHCGEYGDNPDLPRAHYHACIFGHDFTEDREYYRMSGAGFPVYVSRELNRIWGHGMAFIGDLTFDSAAYVASYTMKRITGDDQVEHYLDPHTGALRKPEYATMSRRPGLGSTWFDKYVDEVYPEDFVVAKGLKLRPPKYYDDLLEERDPDLWEQVKTKRREHVVKHQGDLTPERLKVIEKIHDAKTSLLSQKRRAT